MNVDKRYLLGESLADVRATLQEEGYERCFGCPFATMHAAAISARADMQLGFAHTSEAIDHEIYDDLENTMNDDRIKLAEVAADCSGYTPRTSKLYPDMAAMCDSPTAPYPRTLKLARKIFTVLSPKYKP